MLFLSGGASRNPAMRSTVLVAFDTETTGLHPGFDQLVEIAACRFCNGEVIDTFQTLVNPEREIPPAIVELHGITDEMVRDAPRASEAVKSFLEYVRDDHLIAHNAPFDENFISFNCYRFNIKAPPSRIFDTLIMTRRLFPEFKGHSLSVLCDLFDIEHRTKHRGMPDVMGVVGVFQQCIARLERRGIQSWEQFLEWYGDPIVFSPEKFSLLVRLPSEYAPLRNAIELGHRIEIAYYDRDGNKTRRAIDPQGLYVAHGNLYITAFCHLRGANRNFKLERIRAFRTLDGQEEFPQ